MDPARGHLKDRRQSVRHASPNDHGIVSVRVRPGHGAELRNISERGALIETRHRMLPGAPIALHFESTDKWTSIRGRVLRCAVAKLSEEGVSYEGAIEFDGPLFWLPRTS